VSVCGSTTKGAALPAIVVTLGPLNVIKLGLVAPAPGFFFDARLRLIQSRGSVSGWVQLGHSASSVLMREGGDPSAIALGLRSHTV